MYFTQEDYIKIHNWLKANSVRDTQFFPVTELTGQETVAIVQNNINKQLRISQLMKSFELCTLDEFEELTRNGKIRKDMIYGVLRDDGAVVETIYFGDIPFNIQGAQRTPYHFDDWIVKQTLLDLPENISYLGDNADIIFTATRQVTYRWSDGRPDTISIEQGVISFKVSNSQQDTSQYVTLAESPSSLGHFTMNVQSNVGGTDKRIFTVEPEVYSSINKQTQSLNDYNVTFIQGMSFIQVNSQYNVSNQAQDYTIQIQATGYPSDNIPVLNKRNITVVQEQNSKVIDVENISLIATTTPNVYSLSLPILANNTLNDRQATIKISSNMQGVEAETKILQTKRSLIIIGGFQFSHIRAYADEAHTIPITGDIQVPYGENQSIYLEADEGYLLPKDSSYITVPDGVSYRYNSESGQITFNSLTSDLTGVAINALVLSHITYGTPQITLDYPEEGYASGPNTTSPEFSYSIPQYKHYTDANNMKYTANSTITTGATVRFSFKAYDMSGNSINESLSPTAEINETTGEISWKTNASGQRKQVRVTVQVSIKDTDENQQEHSNSVYDTIVQPYATRTVTLKTTQSTGVNIQFSEGYLSPVSYGGNIKITITPKSGYDIPAANNNLIQVLPADGFGEVSYSKAGNTGTLNITNITSNITVEVDGTPQQVISLPVYVGKLTPVESGFTSKASAIISNISSTMIQDAIRNGNIVEVQNLPVTSDSPYTVEISTQRSYLIGLVPLNGENSGYIIKQYNGVNGYDPFEYGDNTNYFSNGGDININNENYKLFAVYSNPNVNVNEVISYRITIEKQV